MLLLVGILVGGLLIALVVTRLLGSWSRRRLQAIKAAATALGETVELGPEKRIFYRVRGESNGRRFEVVEKSTGSGTLYSLFTQFSSPPEVFPPLAASIYSPRGWTSLSRSLVAAAVRTKIPGAALGTPDTPLIPLPVQYVREDPAFVVVAAPDARRLLCSLIDESAEQALQSLFTAYSGRGHSFSISVYADSRHLRVVTEYPLSAADLVSFIALGRALCPRIR